MAELLIGLAGAGFLHIFYRAVEVRWPESYYGLSDMTSYRISLSLGAYIAFRFLPVFIVCFFGSLLALSLGESGVGAALWVAVVHVSATAGRAAFNAIRHKQTFARRLLFLAHLGIAFFVFVAAIAGGLFGAANANKARLLVPRTEGLVDNIWTAIIAGTIGAYLVKATAHETLSPPDIVRRSVSRLPPGTLEYARSVADEQNVDPWLMQALLLVENLQRPSWIRAIERSFGRLFPVGSYGVMQVQSDRPLSDMDSIRLAGERLAASQIARAGTIEDVTRLRTVIEAYNGNPQFVELAVAVYWELRYRGTGHSSLNGQ